MASPQITRKADGLERMDVMAACERMNVKEGGAWGGGGTQEYLDAVPRRERILWFSEGMTSGKCA